MRRNLKEKSMLIGDAHKKVFKKTWTGRLSLGPGSGSARDLKLHGEKALWAMASQTLVEMLKTQTHQ